MALGNQRLGSAHKRKADNSAINRGAAPRPARAKVSPPAPTEHASARDRRDRKRLWISCPSIILVASPLNCLEVQSISALALADEAVAALRLIYVEDESVAAGARLLGEPEQTSGGALAALARGPMP